ncbi:MAG: hypothetical protein CMF59_15475 [Leptospiraceae bacterium]|nr:hypothetical protein [Leptospiraceae bacterium]
MNPDCAADKGKGYSLFRSFFQAGLKFCNVDGQSFPSIRSSKAMDRSSARVDVPFFDELLKDYNFRFPPGKNSWKSEKSSSAWMHNPKFRVEKIVLKPNFR